MLRGDRNYDLAEVKRLATHERLSAAKHREAGNHAGLSNALAAAARYERISATMEITEDREFVDVRDFHLKYSQIVSSTPSLLTKRKSAERANFLLEELQEYATAAGLRISVRLDTATGEVGLNFAPDPRIEPDLAEQADALVDLVYVAKGTAVMNGLPWKALWDDVQGANMRKVPGVTKRGNAMDVTKPPGWVGPRGAAILVENGYNHGHFTFGDGSICEALCVDDPIHQTALVEE